VKTTTGDVLKKEYNSFSIIPATAATSSAEEKKLNKKINKRDKSDTFNNATTTKKVLLKAAQVYTHIIIYSQLTVYIHTYSIVIL